MPAVVLKPLVELATQCGIPQVPHLRLMEAAAEDVQPHCRPQQQESSDVKG
jgi:hypothetical protein